METQKKKELLQLAFGGGTPKSVLTACIVGTVLTSINHMTVL